MEVDVFRAGMGHLVCECDTGYQIYSPFIFVQIKIVIPEVKEYVCGYSSPWLTREDVTYINVDKVPEVICRCGKVLRVQEIIHKKALADGLKLPDVLQQEQAGKIND